MPVDKLPRDRKSVVSAVTPRRRGASLGECADGMARVKIGFADGTEEQARQIGQYEDLGYVVDESLESRGVIMKIPVEEAKAIADEFREQAEAAARGASDANQIKDGFTRDENFNVSHVLTEFDVKG